MYSEGTDQKELNSLKQTHLSSEDLISKVAELGVCSGSKFILPKYRTPNLLTDLSDGFVQRHFGALDNSVEPDQTPQNAASLFIYSAGFFESLHQTIQNLYNLKKFCSKAFCEHLQTV